MRELFVVLSPHTDDAVIGCWELIKNGKVRAIIYCNTEKEEVKELEKFCEDYGIQLFILPDKNDLNFVKKTLDDFPEHILLLPSSNDFHPIHKFYSSWQYCFDRCGFYSVDMNVDWIRKINSFENKKKVLDRYFKTKKDLWKNNAKYYLFEGVVVKI
ncbi:MAG: hypothetical protein QXG39_00375 [Candidatus Aenigmatarchaeota archaeon]